MDTQKRPNDQQDSEANCYERRQVVDMARSFGKNQHNIAIYARVSGPRTKISQGGSDAAQEALKIGKDGVVVASLGQRKACVRASHIVPEGVLLKVNAAAPSGWSSSSPLQLQ